MVEVWPLVQRKNQAILISRLVNNISNILWSWVQNVASGRRIFGVGLNSIHLWRRGAGETNCRYYSLTICRWVEQMQRILLNPYPCQVLNPSISILWKWYLRACVRVGSKGGDQRSRVSPPTYVARFRLPASTPYVLRGFFFFRVLRFSTLLKNQYLEISIRFGTHGHASTSASKCSLGKQITPSYK